MYVRVFRPWRRNTSVAQSGCKETFFMQTVVADDWWYVCVFLCGEDLWGTLTCLCDTQSSVQSLT